MNINELEDRIALKELVDKISILGDIKDFKNQVQFFTEDAVSETRADDKTILKIEGRKEMEKAFAKFNQDTEMAYHFNGQQLFTIDGDYAEGTCYCFITLTGDDNGKKTKTTIGATYKDEYIRLNNQWLIAKRVGNFEWQKKTEIKS